MLEGIEAIAVKNDKEIDQSAARIRVELMIKNDIRLFPTS